MEKSNLSTNKLDFPSSDPYAPRKPGEKPYQREILWDVVIGMLILHIGTFYNLVQFYNGWRPPAAAVLFTTFYGIFSSFGITVGSHRYFSHRSFKANRALELLLILLHTMVFQYSMIKWVYYHRLHHKHSDTNADHTNASRGFFYSHIGWIMVRRHPDVAKFGEKIYMDDIEGDPVIRFQHKYFVPLGILLCFVLPAYVCILMGMTILEATAVQMLRHVAFVHIIGLINSFAHHYGDRPFDKNIKPTDTLIMDVLALGEGSHNYHHVFPWDYRSAEVPYLANASTSFIHFFAWLGWANDFKIASPELIQRRVLRTGDGSHKIYKANDINGNEMKPVWGWDDLDLNTEDREKAISVRREAS